MKLDEKEGYPYFTDLPFKLAFESQPKFLELPQTQMGYLTKELMKYDELNLGKTRLLDSFKQVILNVSVKEP